MEQNTYQVSGMTCQHCVRAVTAEVAALPGVTEVRVDLVPGGESLVHVTADQQVPVDAIGAAIDEAGYELVR